MRGGASVDLLSPVCRPVGLSVVDSRKLKSAVIPENGEGREVGP